jgi:DNA-binding response OmpR family regulator
MQPDRALLLVTPSSSDAEPYAEILRAHGFALRMVSDGRAALLELVERDDAPEAILLVGSLGRMAAWEFLAVARSYLRFWSLPVLIVSADPVARTARKAFAYLEHPAAPEAVLELIERMTCRRREAAG